MTVNEVRMDVSFLYPADRDPYIQNVLSLDLQGDASTITFDGYYRIDTRYYPIETILRVGDNYYHIEITSKTEGKDTSEYGEIEEPDGEILNVCFFPTSILTLTFTVLVEIESNAYFSYLEDRLEKLNAQRKKRIEKDQEDEWKQRVEESKRRREEWFMRKEDKCAI